MNYYALLYELVDDMVTRRAPFREEHLRLAREAHERGELVLAGALAEPVDRALLVFHADDKSKAEAFARKDPYVLNGLGKKWEVRPWNVVVGNKNPAPSSGSAAGIVLRRWSARATSTEGGPAQAGHGQHAARSAMPQRGAGDRRYSSGRPRINNHGARWRGNERRGRRC